MAGRMMFGSRFIGVFEGGVGAPKLGGAWMPIVRVMARGLVPWSGGNGVGKS